MAGLVANEDAGQGDIDDGSSGGDLELFGEQLSSSDGEDVPTTSIVGGSAAAETAAPNPEAVAQGTTGDEKGEQDEDLELFGERLSDSDEEAKAANQGEAWEIEIPRTRGFENCEVGPHVSFLTTPIDPFFFAGPVPREDAQVS